MRTNIKHIIKEILLRENEEYTPKPIAVGNKLYHASHPRNRKRITKNGLIPYRGNQWMGDTPFDEKAIFATNSPKRDHWFDSTFDDDIWEIDTKAIPEHSWYEDPNFGENYHHVYTHDAIPTSALKLIYKGSGKDMMFEEFDPGAAFDHIEKMTGRRPPLEWMLVNRPDDITQEDLTFTGDIQINSPKLKKLPSGLTIFGSLIIGGSFIEEIPDNTYVNINVNVYGCRKLTSIGKNFKCNALFFQKNDPIPTKFDGQKDLIKEYIRENGGWVKTIEFWY